jgi:hypothetical protein
LIPAHDDDYTCFAIVYGKFSRDYARTVSDSGNGYPDYELVFEWNYKVQLTKFCLRAARCSVGHQPGWHQPHSQRVGSRRADGIGLLSSGAFGKELLQTTPEFGQNLPPIPVTLAPRVGGQKLITKSVFPEH